MGEALQVEWLCACELARLVGRKAQYAGLVIPLYAQGLCHGERGRILRATYCLARLIDDVIDGDREASSEPLAYVTELMRAARAAEPPTEDVGSQLAAHVFARIDSYGAGACVPTRRFCELVDCMLLDYQRAKQRLVLGQAALLAHHRLTFASSLDVTLCIAGSTTRASALDDLVRAQAALYTLRDLRIDLARGVVNIPREALEASDLLRWTVDHPERLLEAPAVRAFMLREHAIGRSCLERLEQSLDRVTDSVARRVVGPLLFGLRPIARRLERSFRSDAPGFERLRPRELAAGSRP